MLTQTYGLTLTQTYGLIGVGILVCCLGIAARTYMKVRLNPTSTLFSRRRDLTKRYRRLIRKREAPLWPLLVSVSFIPAGVAIVFGALLSSR
jgi:hypothetical protein